MSEIQAVISNSKHPEYGVVTISFPIHREEYDQVIEMMEAMEIGDVMSKDCHIDELRGQMARP